jgi:16S rRNA (adenine1518-N6/adenine1519-N6)-dimethyltransferase
MLTEDYKSMLMTVRASKKLGQHFLINPEVAKAEARYAEGKRVVEMGPGLGILTDALCSVSKNVVAVERDRKVFELLRENISAPNLKLINADFFDIDYKELGNPEIMVSNIPYNLSSKTIGWLAEHGTEAVLCLQKEFVEHMLAEPDTRDYSKLSVITRLQFNVSHVLDVPLKDFYPVPNVNSIVAHIKPKQHLIEPDALSIIGAIMSHKKKKVRNAINDARSALSIDPKEARKLSDSVPFANERLFKLEPEKIMEIVYSIKEFKRRLIT